ncbi:MAG: hypothetical protein ACE5JO_01200, partial [Candidatus Binatia bacterium]
VPVLGSKKFIDNMQRRIRKRQTDLKEVPEAKTYIRPDFRACLDVVEKIYGSGREALMRSRRGQRNEARALAIYLCRRMAGMKHEEIAKLFGVGGYSAVSSWENPGGVGKRGKDGSQV